MHKTFSGAIALLAFVLIQGSALAQTPSAVYDVLIDLDQNSTTGCVSDPTGLPAFGGFERRLRATLDPDTQTLTALETQTCVDAGFENLVTLSAGQPAGLNNGVDNSDVIEFSVPINDFDPDGRVSIDLAFAADSGTGSDILATAAGAPISVGLPFLNLIPVPALSVLALLIMAGLLVVLAWAAHRRAGQVGFFSLVLLLATVAWAMNFIADGQVSDWAGIGPVANDPAGDASNGSDLIDIRAAFVAIESDVLHVRLDLADIENQPPEVQDDGFSTVEDTALSVGAPGVLTNDSDSNSDPITAVLDSSPANAASFTLNPDGSFDYTPEDDFNGSDTFTYVANDGQADSAIATVTLTVDPINDPPVASDDSASTNEDAQVIIDVLTNDSDLDGNLDPASVSIVTPPNNGTAAANPSTGEITYTKTGDFNGTDTFIYEVCDDGTPTPAECDTASVEMTIDSVNDAPSFVGGGDVSVLEDAGAPMVAAWATAISAGPADEAGQTLTFNIVANDNPGLFSVAPAIDAASGDLSFTPATDANGTANISITLSDDGGTANGGNDTSPQTTFEIELTAVNDEPGFVTGGDVTVLEDSGAYDQAWASAIDAGASDEAGQTLTFNITNNTNASLFAAAPTVDPTTGNLSFTPAANTQGSADITLELADDGGTANGGDNTSAPVTFTISVADVNDAPSFTAGPDVNAPEDDGAQAIPGWASAIDDGDGGTQTLTFNVSSDNAALFSTQPAISPAGELTFTSATDANGSAQVTVILSDDGGTANGGEDTSPPATFTITIDPVNDAPVFTAGPDQTLLEDASAQSIPGWATGIGDGDDGSQALTFNLSNDNNALFAVQPAVDETGLLTFTPAADANGSALVTVTLSDDGSATPPNVNTSAPQTFTISLTAVNDVPSFNVGADQIVSEDSGPLSIAGWATAINPGAANEAGQTLSFNITGNDNAGLFAAGPVVSPSGELSFTPAANVNGSATISLELSDDGGTASGGVDTSASQTFNILVEAVNDAPSFTPGADVSVEEDSGAYSQPWAVAISPGPVDEAGQTLSFNITGNDNAGLFAAGPAIDASGNLSFTPQTGTVGTANLTVVLMDNGGTLNGGVDTSPTVNLAISVLQINDPPSFVAGPDQIVNEDSGPSTINAWATAISAGPPDEAGQTVSFMIIGNNNAALFGAGPSVSSTGDLSFTPASNANGIATITLVLMDDGGTANGGVDTSAPQSFDIIVNSINDAPLFTPGGDVDVPEDSGPYSQPWASAISAGAANESGQLLSFDILNNTNPGIFAVAPAIDAMGNLSFTPVGSVAVTETAMVSVRLSDDGGVANGGVDVSPTQVFAITVTAVDDPPTAVSDNALVNEDDPASTIDVLFNDTDPDGGPISISSVSQPANGTVVITNGGADLSYEPDPNYCNDGTPTDDFTYSLTPGGSTATVQVAVTCLNDPPSVTGTPPTQAVTGNVSITVPSAQGLIGSVSVTDPDGAAGQPFNASGGPGPGVTSFLSANGGSVTITDPATGTYTYTSPAGFQGADSFDYIVCDSGAPLPAMCSAPITVTANVSDVIWFIDNSAAMAGNGTQAAPFNALADFEAINDGAGTPAEGDCIFIDGTGTSYTGGLGLQTNQTLVGSGAGDAISTICGIALAPNSIALPSTGGADPIITNPGGTGITLASGNTVRGVTVGNTSAQGISGTSGSIGTLNISETSILQPGGGIALANGTANVVFDVLESTSNVQPGINLTNVNGTIAAASGVNGLIGAGTSAEVIAITGGTVTVTYPGPVSQAGPGNVLSIDGGHSGSVTLSGSITATGSTGLLLDNADGVYNLQGPTTISGGVNGLRVINGSDGTLNITNGASDIRGTQGVAFRVSNSTMNIDYNGRVNHRNDVDGALASARAVEIVGGTGLISIDGEVIAGTFGAPATAEVVFLSNTGSANPITFNYVDAIMRDSAALVSQTSGRVAMNRLRANCQGDLTVGGETHCLQISDTTSAGFTIESLSVDLDDAGENGGALSLTNTPGVWTIEDTSGGLTTRFQTAVFGSTFGTLNLATVDSATSPGGIATGSMISNNQPALDLTNGTVNMLVGNLQAFNTVTGMRLVNTDGPGVEVLDGTIPNTTGDSVVLQDTINVTLNSMEISGSQANGIFGNNVSNFTLRDSLITNNGNAVNEGGLRFDNLLGTALISGSMISGSAEHNIEITNTSGVLSGFMITGSNISSTSAALGADGLLLETRGSAQAAVTIIDTDFEDNRSDGIQINAIDASFASLTVDDSRFFSSTDASPAGSIGARGIVLAASANADLTFDIGSSTGNQFTNFSPNIGEEAINIALVSTSTTNALMSGRVNNNTFINSGGAVGVDVRGDGALVMAIDSNTANTSRQAIDVIVGDAVGDAATADVTITNNTLTVAGTPANPNNEAIGWLGDRNTVSCLNIRGNNGTASGTRDDIVLDDFTVPAGAVNLESGPADCGGACATSEAHLLANNTITDAFSDAVIVAPGSCVTVP